MEKIVITSSEVDQLGRVSPTPSGPKNSRKAAWLALGILGLIGALIICILVATGGPDTQSVQDYELQQRNLINKSLSSTSRDDDKKMIETIHGPTVTYKDAVVKSVKAVTFDGSNIAEKNGGNVSVLKFVVNYRWTSLTQNMGYTDVLYVFDVQRNAITTARVLDTNALINLADERWWFDVGYAIGALLLGGS